MKHNLIRTSPKGKGQKFIGMCVNCGAEGLRLSDTAKECSNPANLTIAEVLEIVIKDRDGHN